MPRPAALVPVAAALVSGLLFLVPLLALGLGGVALVAAAVIGIAVGTALWFGGEPLALAQIGGRPGEAAEFPRLHNILDGLCGTAGVAKPAVIVVDDPAVNTCTTARGRRAHLIVTTGLLDQLEVIELEGVLAHELVHLKGSDARSGTLAVPLAVVAPGLAGRAIDAGREPNADAGAVTLTRYPPGLLAALEKLASGPFAVRSGWRATQHLWLAQDGPSLNERIDTLREL